MEALALGDVAAMLDIVLAVAGVGQDPARVLDVVVSQLHRVIACDAILLTVVLASGTRTAYWRSSHTELPPSAPARAALGQGLSIVSRGAGTTAIRIDCMRSRGPFEERDRLALELLAPRLTALLVGAKEPASTLLSDRERQVLQLAAAGLTNKEIGRELFVAPDTVRKHLEHIYAKLRVHNRTEASALLHQAAIAGS